MDLGKLVVNSAHLSQATSDTLGKRKDTIIIDGCQVGDEDLPGVWRLISDMRANAQNVKIGFEAVNHFTW